MLDASPRRIPTGTGVAAATASPEPPSAEAASGERWPTRTSEARSAAAASRMPSAREL
jgi:hypothetical protein